MTDTPQLSTSPWTYIMSPLCFSHSHQTNYIIISAKKGLRKFRCIRLYHIWRIQAQSPRWSQRTRNWTAMCWDFTNHTSGSTRWQADLCFHVWYCRLFIVLSHYSHSCNNVCFLQCSIVRTTDSADDHYCHWCIQTKLQYILLMSIAHQRKWMTRTPRRPWQCNHALYVLTWDNLHFYCHRKDTWLTSDSRGPTSL